MTRYIFSLLLGACCLVWSVLPVNAHWEFSRWGMSPEQVVQASNGQARPPGPPDIPSVLLTQDWQSGRFVFTVWYFFENVAGAQRLTKVQLQLKNPESRSALLAALKNKYGPPSREVRGRISVVEWENSGDNIHYLTDVRTDTIHYEPLAGQGR